MAGQALSFAVGACILFAAGGRLADARQLASQSEPCLVHTCSTKGDPQEHVAQLSSCQSGGSGRQAACQLAKLCFPLLCIQLIYGLHACEDVL